MSKKPTTNGTPRLVAHYRKVKAERARQKPVVIRDILKGQERSGGFGLYGHSVRLPATWAMANAEQPYAIVEAIDGAVAEISQVLGWSVDEAIEFMDSKDGRWCGDELSGITVERRELEQIRPEIRKIVNKYAEQFKDYLYDKEITK